MALTTRVVSAPVPSHPAMNPLVEKLFEEVGSLLASGLAGYIVSNIRIGRRFDRALASMAKDFEELRKMLSKGLKLELDSLKDDVEREVEVVRDKLRDVQKMAEDLRQKSGDYTKEAELANFVQQVQSWMLKTNTAIGRLEGRVNSNKARLEAITTRPPPIPSSKPPPALPKPPRLPPRGW